MGPFGFKGDEGDKGKKGEPGLPASSPGTKGPRGPMGPAGFPGPQASCESLQLLRQIHSWICSEFVFFFLNPWFDLQWETTLRGLPAEQDDLVERASKDSKVAQTRSQHQISSICLCLLEYNYIRFAHTGDNGACECSTVLSPDGPAGPDGERGDAGMTGEFGQEGDVGDPGPVGEDGIPVRIVKSDSSWIFNNS